MDATKGRILSTVVGAATLFGWVAHAHAASAPGEGAASAQTVKLPAGPGSVRGLAADPTVNEFSGQASYAMPLELPKGPRGFAPELSLAYHGELGNGPLGIGWQVGVPLIRRSTMDGVPGYGASDTLELVGVGGGGRLVKISALGAPAEYRVEGQANLIKIVELSGGFEVSGPDGTRYRLGTSAASRQDAGTRVATWMADEVIDVAGQRVSYAYQKDDGQIYLSRVAWGPNNLYAAVFELEARPDKTSSWRTGFRVGTGLRVKAIRVEVASQVQRRYELGYDPSFGLSRLAQVRTIGRGGVDTDGSNAMPPLGFTYATIGAATTQQLAVDDWRLDDTTVLADVDGDGAADLVQLRAGQHRYRQNRGGSFGPPIAITGATTLSLLGDDGARLADVEGKNVPNLIARSSKRWAPYRIAITPAASPGGTPTASWATWSTWDSVSTQDVPFRGADVVLTDVNGDARMDVVTWGASSLQVRFGTGNGLSAPVSQPLVAGNVAPDPAMRWMDVNGDGLADIVYLRTGPKMRVYLGHGDGTFELFDDVAYPAGLSATSDLRFGDLNRDGLLDLVNVTQGEARLYLGVPGNQFAATATVLAKPPTAATDAMVSIQDANGNGSEDVVWSSTGPQGGIWALDLAGPTNAGMLVAVDNGLGKTLSITYTASTAIAGAAANEGTPWSSFLPIAIPVVTRTVDSTGASDLARITDFLVRDGFWDVAEHRFGGFVTSKKTQHGGVTDGDLVTETSYQTGTGLNRVLRGRPTRVTRSMVVGGVTTVLDVTTNTWTAKKIASLPNNDLLRKAVLGSVRVEHREGRPAGAPLVTRLTTTFDAEGRPTLDIDEGRLDLAGDDRRVERSFADSVTPWIRDLPAEEKITLTDGTVVSWKQTLYGDEAAQLPLGQAGKGWKRVEQGYLAEESRFVVSGTWTYDTLGNAVASVEAGVRREVDYDANHLHPLVERLYTGATVLSWTSTWDDVLAAPLTVTRPDGVVMHASYDGLARPIAFSLGDSAPYVAYRYTWAAPRPRTETFTWDGDAQAIPALPATWTPGSHWRHEIAVANGAGEQLYKLVQLDAARYLVKDWQELDARGRVTFRGDAVEWTGAGLPAARPADMVGQTVLYDAADRQTAQFLADGSAKRSTYAAFVATTSSPGLAPVSVEKDGRDQVISNRRETEVTQVLHDAAGRIVGYQSSQDGGASFAATHAYGYDTLGRLVRTSGSDGGARTLRYDDGGRLVRVENAAHQALTVSYDGAGRVLERVLDDGTRYTYHYDAACAGAPGGTLVAGHLACVDEPTGRASFGYDAFGLESVAARVVDGVAAVRTTSFAPSGLALRTRFDDQLDLAFEYDAAGRPVRIGDLWSLASQDPSGRILDERFGNGVHQRYLRDQDGLPARIDVDAPDGTDLYGVTVTRAAWGAVTSIQDDDGRGLDHSAAFTYDARGRLTHAALGAGADSYDLGFGYDDLQNMTSRTIVGPRTLGAFAGAYHYGEAAGPRQLTSVTGANGQVHLFGYDAAGRQVREDGKSLAFNALDQLVAVSGLPGDRTVAHAYGFDGLRVKTTAAGGASRLWFDAGIAQVGQVREYSVTLGERVLARVSVDLAAAPGATAAAGWSVDPALLRGLWLAALAAIGLALFLAGRRSPRSAWARATASGAITLVLQACSGGGAIDVAAHRGALAQAAQVIYFHQAIAPGPVLFTGDGGNVVEERRYEPFGSPIDAAGAASSGAVDFDRVDVDALNHVTDPSTGWSDAGARWFQPESARWQVIDPPTLEGSEKYAAEPWSLNPYQYTDSNPILYWDPDGRDKVDISRQMPSYDAQAHPAANTNLAPGQTLTATAPYQPIQIMKGFQIWPLPNQAQLAGSPTVKAAFTSAWNDSFTAADGNLHEQGGWIYWSPLTGLSVKRQTAGEGAAIPLWNPPAVEGSVVVGVFHTHPNTGPEWDPSPSPPDVHNAGIRNVPSFVVSDQGVYAYGATSYGSTGKVELDR